MIKLTNENVNMERDAAQGPLKKHSELPVDADS